MTGRFIAIIFLLTAPATFAQIRAEEVLEADPQRDRFEYANLAYERAENAQNQQEKAIYYKKASELFTDFLRDFPRPAEESQVRYRLGTSYLYTGMPDSAARQFRSILKSEPDGHIASLAAYRLASLAYEKRDFARAAPYFATSARAAAQPQLRHRALYFEGSCQLLAKNKSKAKDAFARLVEDPAKERNVYFDRAALQLALLFQEEDNSESALKYFVLLLKKSSTAETLGQALVGAGLASAKLGQTEQANTYLETVLKSSAYKDHHTEAQSALIFASYADKDYKRVAEIYRRRPVPRKGKTAAKLHLMAGKSEMAQENYNRARDILLKAERALPKSSIAFEAAFRRLVCFFETGSKHVPVQADAFIEIYSRTNAGAEEIQIARLMKAETHFAAKNWISAARSYNKINSRLIDDANRASMLFHKGWSLAESDDPNGAVQALSEFISSYKENQHYYEAIVKRGESYLHAGNFDLALKDFDTIISVFEGQPLAALALQKSAKVQREQDNLKDMILRYDKLIAEYPDLATRTKANALYWIGWALFKEDKYIEAAEKLSAARELDPANFNDIAGTRIALCYYMAKDVDKLLESVARVRTDVPGKQLPPRSLTWLGIKSFERRDFTNAVVYLNLVVDDKEPENTTTYIWKHLAKASIEVGAYKSALNAVENVLGPEEHPVAKADAYLDKGQALLGLNEFVKASESAEAGLALQTQGKLNAELQLLLGDIAFGRKDYNEAAKQYVVTAELVVDNQITPVAVYKAAKALEMAGNASTAKIYQDRLSEEFPNFQLTQRWIGGPA